jgi:hypothetical protein
MRVAIYFDREPGRCAEEIYDKPSDHLLTSEMETVQLVPAKHPPKSSLLRGHRPAEIPGEFELLGSD